MSSSLHTLVRSLRLRRGRERRGLALAEGVRLVEEALGAGVAIRHLRRGPAREAPARGRALKAALTAAGLRIDAVSDLVFESLAATEHPQGILAVIEPPQWTLQDVHPAPRAPALVLDAVQDPGNVGTLVRTAVALRAAGVLALPGTAELTNPKTLRATMGGCFRLPYVTLDEAALREWAGRNGLRVLPAAAGAEPLSRPLAEPAALVLGNEGSGIRPSLETWADGSTGIPLRQAAESLNVAVAAGILLHEVTRE